MRSLHTQQLESSTHFPKLEKFDVQQQRPSVARKKKKKSQKPQAEETEETVEFSLRGTLS